MVTVTGTGNLQVGADLESQTPTLDVIEFQSVQRPAGASRCWEGDREHQLMGQGLEAFLLRARFLFLWHIRNTIYFMILVLCSHCVTRW